MKFKICYLLEYKVKVAASFQSEKKSENNTLITTGITIVARIFEVIVGYDKML